MEEPPDQKVKVFCTNQCNQSLRRVGLWCHFNFNSTPEPLGMTGVPE